MEGSALLQKVPVRLCMGVQVLIFDYDVHCGNGTVDIFSEDPSVMVIDMHENGVWPHTGHIENIGRGSGKGYTIDIPLPGAAAFSQHWHARTCTIHCDQWLCMY